MIAEVLPNTYVLFSVVGSLPFVGSIRGRRNA